MVLLGKGDHQITSSWTGQYGTEFATTLGITRSNITFLGKGRDTTTILGGFGIYEQENILFKNMTVTNTSDVVAEQKQETGQAALVKLAK